MKLYNIYWYDCSGNKSYVDTTNNLDKWLVNNNKLRDEGERLEELDDFEIQEVEAIIYSEEV